MPRKKKIDYSLIDADWRAGIMSLTEMAAAYEQKTGVAISHQAIDRHYHRLGIPRDLSARIKAQAEARVLRSIVENNVDESSVINTNAEYLSKIDISHRKCLAKLYAIESRITDELVDLDISASLRLDMLKKLTETARNRIELERKVLKLDTFTVDSDTTINLTIKPV